MYGAFSVGTLTAIASDPGQLSAKNSSNQVPWEFGRAVKEKRRYSATNMELRYYQFMSGLVQRHKDTVMEHDYRHR
jgi:hypothetical protein